MRWLILFLALIPAPVRALETCEDLWFTRNLLFHRAGNCFASALGKAVFGNEGCTPGAVRVDDATKLVVGRLRALEAEWDCDVDTGRDTLAVPQLGLRKLFVDLPIATGTESACVGWRGGRLPLRTERSADGLLTGAARDGDTLLFQFGDVDGWSFVEVLQNDTPAGAGWARIAIDGEVCEMLAG